MTSQDVIVVGLGAMGSAVAFHLASRGLRVLGVEQYSPAHERGSSHGRSRIIRLAYYESPEYVPLLLRAWELWEELEERSARKLLSRTGALMVGSSESELFRGSLRSATEHDLPHEVLDAQEIRRRFPSLDPPPDTLALYEERAGFIVPEEGVKAHLQLAGSLGAELRFEERLLSWEERDGGVLVETSRGSYGASHLVLAPGPWAPQLLGELGGSLYVERQVMVWFSASCDGLPVIMWEADDGRIFYCIPEGPERIKAALHHGGKRTTPETLDRRVHEEDVEAIKGYLRKYAPALAGALVESSVCMYTNSPDLNFVVGPHPRHPRIILACGFSGHGYKFSGLIGEVTADLVIAGRTGHPIKLFSPARLQLQA